MDKEKEEELVKKHVGLVLSQSSSFRETSVVDKDDYAQIGYLALLKAIRKHNPDKSQLQTFAWKIIHNELITAYNKAKKSPSQFDAEPFYEEEPTIEQLLPPLTEAEREVVNYKLQGYSIKEIASFLDKTQKYVKSILDNIYKKIKDRDE
jgi:RNA polymerase sigma factor (sigma-70 family)